MRPRHALLILGLLLPAPLSAQVGLGGLEATVGYAGWTGDDFADFEPGFRLQLSIMNRVAPTVGFGVTGTWAPVPVEGTDSDATELGLGLTLRWAPIGSEAVRLFLAGHLGWTRLSVDIPSSDLDAQEDGFVAGPGVGVTVPVSRSITFVAGGDLHFQNYSNAGFGGAPGDDASDTGWRWSVKAGLAFSTGRRGGR